MEILEYKDFGSKFEIQELPKYDFHLLHTISNFGILSDVLGYTRADLLMTELPSSLRKHAETIAVYLAQNADKFVKPGRALVMLADEDIAATLATVLSDFGSTTVAMADGRVAVVFAGKGVKSEESSFYVTTLDFEQPIQNLRDLVNLFSFGHQLVFDPFMYGSGVVGAAACLERRVLGLNLDTTTPNEIAWEVALWLA